MLFTTVRNIYFVASWYGATLCTLLFSLLFLIYLSFPQKMETPKIIHYQLYQTLPSTSNEIKMQNVTIGKTDGRSVLLSRFFQVKRSPLAEAANKFIEVADQYSLDFRLLPSIAMQESNGGKIMPKNSYNPFGFGIWGQKQIRFASFEEAIEKVGKALKRDYIDQGLITPEQIMAKYTPPSLQKGGAWALAITAFMEQI